MSDGFTLYQSNTHRRRASHLAQLIYRRRHIWGGSTTDTSHFFEAHAQTDDDCTSLSVRGVNDTHVGRTDRHSHTHICLVHIVVAEGKNFAQCDTTNHRQRTFARQMHRLLLRAAHNHQLLVQHERTFKNNKTQTRSKIQRNHASRLVV